MTPSRKRAVQLFTSLLFYAITVPILTRLVDPSGLFGALFVVPLTVITRQRGRNAGLLMGALGIVLNTAIWLAAGAGQQALRHYPVSALTSLLAGCLAFAAVVIVLDKFHSMDMQEKRNRFLIQNIAVGVIIVDPEESVTFANPAAESVFGTSRGALTGKNLRDFLGTDEYAFIRTQTEKRRRGEKSTYETVIKRFGGENRHVLVTAVPQFDARGVFAGTAGTFQDVTETFHLRQKLDEERTQLQTLLNNLPDAVYMKDRESRFILVNPALAEMMNAGDPQNLIGKTDHDFYSKEEADEYLADEKKLLQEEKPVVNKREPRAVTDSLRWIATTKAPIKGIDGKVRGLVGISRDITERIQREEQLEHERALMQSLMDTSPDSIWFKDLESRFILANKAMARHFDIEDAAELNGKTDFDFFTSEQAQVAFDNEQRVVKTGQPIIDHVVKETWLNKPDSWVSTTKMPLRDSKGQIIGTFGIARDITERRKMEESLRESEEHYRNTFMNAPIGFFHSTAAGKLIEVNPAFSRMMGYDSPEEIVEAVNKRSVAEVLYMDPQKRPSIVRGALEAGGQWQQFENQYRSKEGRTVFARVTLRRYEHAGAKTDELEGIVEDITQQQHAEEERKRLQAQLLHAQKMEAVGRLAGGIAHDFNNILTAIYGYCDVGLLTTAAKEPLLRNIRQAAERAANLTSRLLAFSRGHAFQPRTLDLGELLTGMKDMLKRLLGEDVALHTLGKDDLWGMRADPAQMEQVIMNLVVNSRDAMPTGGTLTIESSNVHLGADYAHKHLEVKEGDYVMLAVSDTGQGMDSATLERLYEPFFTTKEIGKGTGLGLATVYGIVKQSGGYIYCYSEVGKGTTFKMYFPRSEREKKASETTQSAPAAVGGSEAVLFVDDDDGVRTLAVSVLETAGYVVTSAESGAQALALVPSISVAPKLLITDVVMPGLGGVETARRLVERFPGMRVLYISGYTKDAILRQGLLQESAELLPKPFATTELLRSVRKVLDS